MKTLQRTLTIIKPDAVRKNAIGDIIEQFEKSNFRILCLKMLEISKHQAEQFYAVHAGKAFYNTLTDFMSSGPIVVLALEKENAIADLRKLMGATNPAKAEEGTIRKKWATNIEHNAIHGSDAEDTAAFEISYLRGEKEIGNAVKMKISPKHHISTKRNPGCSLRNANMQAIRASHPNRSRDVAINLGKLIRAE